MFRRGPDKGHHYRKEAKQEILMDVWSDLRKRVRS